MKRLFCEKIENYLSITFQFPIQNNTLYERIQSSNLSNEFSVCIVTWQSYYRLNHSINVCLLCNEFSRKIICKLYGFTISSKNCIYFTRKFIEVFIKKIPRLYGLFIHTVSEENTYSHILLASEGGIVYMIQKWIKNFQREFWEFKDFWILD